MSIKDYAATEQTTLDYQEKLEERGPKSWLKSVSAFANTSGGLISLEYRASPMRLSRWKTRSMSSAR